MLNKLFLASLLVLSATTTTTATFAAADATPASRIRMPINVCTKGGTIVFAVDHKVDVDWDGFSTSRFVLFATGGWQYTEWKGGKIVRSGGGCISLSQVKRLQKPLAAAPWSTTRYEVACMAYSASYTEYQFLGKHVWTERLCDAQGLDDQSQKALASANAIVNKLIASVK
jgi:hypothetical protein